MSFKNTRKIGFFTAILMVISTIVGIGIFFKSHTVLRTNNWNGWGTLVAWILGGLLSLGAAVSYGEIGTIKTKEIHGLSGWSAKIGGTKYGYFTSFNYSFFYFSLLMPIIGFFQSEALFNILTSFDVLKEPPKIYVHIIVGTSFAAFLMVINYISLKTTGIIAQVTTIFKWLPLLFVSLAGIVLANHNLTPEQHVYAKGDSFFGHDAFSNGSKFSILTMLASLPGVLFAFDSFLNVGTITEKIKGGEKRAATAIVFAMISVLFLYLLLAVASILHGTGMVSGKPMGLTHGGILDQIFSAKVASTLGQITSILIAVSVFGVVNGIGNATVNLYSQSIHAGLFFGSKRVLKKYGEGKSLLFYLTISIVFWLLVFGIYSAVINSDSMVDGISNAPVLFLFFIYAFTIFKYIKKGRNNFATKKISTKMFYAFSWFAIIGIVLCVLYQMLFVFFIDAIIHPSETSHWGLFQGDSGAAVKKAFPTRWDAKGGKNVYISLAQGSLIMYSMLLIWFTFPLINSWLIKKYEKRNIWLEIKG